MTATFVDADTHIVEDTDVWATIPKEDQDVAPRVLAGQADTGKPGVFPTGQYWLIDGELYGKGGQALIHYQDGTRNLHNAKARVAQMDEWGIDAQIIYPSTFLVLTAKSPRTELVMARAYNRYMANVCGTFKKRLYWIAAVSAQNIAESAKDMKEWADKGACGILLRGYEDDKLLNHKHFWPIYKAADELGLPICVHIGSGSRSLKNVEGQGGNPLNLTVPNLLAYSSIVNHSIPAEFPNLKFGIIESGAEWLPFAMSRARRYRHVYNVADHTEKLLADGRLFVTCEFHENIPHIVESVGEDALMLGTDYGHSDTSTELRAHEYLGKRPDLSAPLAEKITSTNARKFYRM